MMVPGATILPPPLECRRATRERKLRAIPTEVAASLRQAAPQQRAQLDLYNPYG